jgi:HPt (histidine-containing phosphotransfer) domain-containing protein
MLRRPRLPSTKRQRRRASFLRFSCLESTDNHLEEAERLAHNLHGVAGSFGADRLKQASKTLELALAKGDESNLLGLVQSFEVAMNEVLESAETLANHPFTEAASRSRNEG